MYRWPCWSVLIAYRYVLPPDDLSPNARFMLLRLQYGACGRLPGVPTLCRAFISVSSLPAGLVCRHRTGLDLLFAGLVQQ